MVPFTTRRFFLGIDVTVNLHGVPVSGHVRSNTVVSSMLQYSTLNTKQLYCTSDSVAVTDSAAGLVRFTKYETGNIVQLALRADQHWFIERRTQSQYVADHPIQTIFAVHQHTQQCRLKHREKGLGILGGTTAPYNMVRANTTEFHR